MKKFHENVVDFSIRGIDMIGNLDNGFVIGLDANGKSMIEKIRRQSDGSDTALQNEIPDLSTTLEKYAFFEKTTNNRTKLKAAYIHFNSKCNLHCTGCYSFVDDRNAQDGFSKEFWVRALNDLHRRGLDAVTISGGEPFLRDDLAELCEHMKQIGISHVTAITNGTLSHEKYEKVLPFLDSITVSVDGYDENSSFIRDRGIMPTVLATVKWLKEKLPTAMVVTLHKKNVPYMYKYEEMAKKLGIFMSYSIYTVEKDLGNSDGLLFDEKDFLQIGKRIASGGESIPVNDTPMEQSGLCCRVGCGFGGNMISIDHWGNVYPCHMLHLAECNMGNIHETSVDNVLDFPRLKTTDITVDHVEGCNSCEYQMVCGGGCRGRSYLYHRSFLKKDPYCLAAKEFYDQIFAKIVE